MIDEFQTEPSTELVFIFHLHFFPTRMLSDHECFFFLFWENHWFIYFFSFRRVFVVNIFFFIILTH